MADGAGEGEDANDPLRRARPARLARWLMVGAFLALAGMPLFLIWGRRELVRWQVAAAASQFARGEEPTALAAMEAAAARYPEDDAIVLALADHQYQAGQYSQSAKTAARLSGWPVQPAGRKQKTAALHPYAVDLEVRALTAAGQAAEALQKLKALLKELARIDPDAEIGFANNLSYQRALAGREISAAIIQMETLFAAVEQLPFGRLNYLTVDSRTLAAGTLVALEFGGLGELRPLLDRQIEALEDQREFLIDEQLRLRPLAAGDLLLPAPKETREQEEISVALLGSSWELAVLLTVRAYVLEKSGLPADRESALQARQQVDQLGHDPGRILGRLPDLRGCLDQIEEHAPLLDTWGVLLLQSGEPDKALHVLNVACAAAERAQEVIATRLGENPNRAGRGEDLNRQRVHSIAVQRLHRASCLEALGQFAEAGQDHDRVRALGFDPADPALF